jgi:hypothetical protein
MLTQAHSPAAYSPGKGRGGIDIRVNATHHVVDHRTHRHQFMHRVRSHITGGQIADHRQALVDLLLAQVAQIQMHHLAPAGADGPPLLLLMPEGLTQAIPRPQFHGLQARPGIGGAQIVVLQIAVAIFIHQDAALAAARLGEQYAGAGQARRVILDELHVLQGMPAR